MEPYDFVDHSEERARMAAELDKIGLGNDEKLDYLVTGRNEIHDVPPGEVVSLTASEAAVLLVSGNVRLVEVPVEVLAEEVPDNEEAPADETDVADETGHSPEPTESE